MNAGSIVDVDSGKYTGCRLTYCGTDPLGWAICLNSYEPGGYVRVRRITFVRDQAPYDPNSDDPVFWNDWVRRITFAQRMTQIVGADVPACVP